MSRCGCTSPASCLCSLAAGSSLTVTGVGSLADPWVPALSLSTDADQLASILDGKLLVPGGGERADLESAGISVTQSSAVTFGLSGGRYRKRGREVDAWARLAFTSAGTAGNDITLTMGTLPTPLGTTVPVGVFGYFDNGSLWYEGLVFFLSANTGWRLQASGGTSSAYLGSSPSIAIASGDALSMVLMYETAS